jgi:RimJ/RimL family protein N-acetyltransferase
MKYKVLHKQVFSIGNFAIVPIRFEDRMAIMKWRNEQIYHLRQQKPLTIEDQDFYFNNVVTKLFDQEQPNQILFSFLENDLCIGYGGLVHINWIDKNAEISFVMKTELEKEHFIKYWSNYLMLIEEVAFNGLDFHKIYTYAFDLRPHLYETMEASGYFEEARLKEHCFFNSEFIDVVIHSKINAPKPLINKEKFLLRYAEIKDSELLFNWANDKEVRNNSINQQHINWDNHLKWFTSKLNTSETKILILECDDNALGQIRIDLVGDFWIIDYSIDHQFRGIGLGKEIVRLILNKFPGYKFKATVKKENMASLGVFNKLGFRMLPIENNHFCNFEYNTIET